MQDHGSMPHTRNLFYKGQMEIQLVLSLIFQYTFLTASGQKRLVFYLAVPYSLSLIKHTACTASLLSLKSETELNCHVH